MIDYVPAMETRERILDAALRVYVQNGTRGATTRRIAESAGLTEVTLFRHFPTKAELLREAMDRAAAEVRVTPLPTAPSDPSAELATWCRAELDGLYRVRGLLRTSMGEFEENPEAGSAACSVPDRVAAELLGYLGRLVEGGWIQPNADIHGAARMLMGSLFAEAVSRDIMPDLYPGTLDESAARYATLALRALETSFDRRAR
jgi:AcrR family transcriptional regulator